MTFTLSILSFFVIDARHTFKLLLRHTHLKNHHQGIHYLRSKVQQRYAIPKLRSTLRSIKSNCVLCRKFRAATVQPIMADLPKERLAYQSSSFTNTGVDYFGPFYVTVRRTTENRWGFLFTSLTTRAVHVEVVPSMNTSSCVMRVERFISRRGSPAMMWSHNDTNFIGADKELCECIEKWIPINIAAELAHKSIKCRLNPPSAPHQGGIWERLIRSFKRVLYTILGTRRLTDELLNTTFCLVEHALNARPLTPVSADPSDLGAKTPNHFLLGNQAIGTRPSLASTSSIAVSGTPVHRPTSTQFGHVGLRSMYLRWQTPAGHHLKVGDLVWIIEKATLGVTIQLLGLKNSVTAPTASPAPPSYARCPERSSAHSLSFYQSF